MEEEGVGGAGPSPFKTLPAGRCRLYVDSNECKVLPVHVASVFRVVRNDDRQRLWWPLIHARVLASPPACAQCVSYELKYGAGILAHRLGGRGGGGGERGAAPRGWFFPRA